MSFSEALSTGDYALTLSDLVTDRNGLKLDGDANGTVGGEFVRTFLVGQLAPIGGEVRVNTTIAGNQQTYPDVSTSTAIDACGNYLIAWTQSGVNGMGVGLFGQRYNAAGRKLGSEFKINVTTTGRQERPSVAMDAAGSFVAAWMSQGEDDSDFGIYARRYDAAENVWGRPFRVNTFTALGQYYPHVAMRSNGEFLITWSSYEQVGAADDIFGQRFDASGVRVGNEFQINTTTAGDQYFSKAAFDADGNFIVAWNGGNHGSGFGIYARRFNASGTPLDASDILVNTNSLAGNQMYPSVVMSASGDAVITWTGPDESGHGIFAKRYVSLSDTVGTVLSVSESSAGDQQWSTVAMDAAGDFVITWTGLDVNGGEEILAQAYASDGTLNGVNFAVNAHTPGNQRFGAIAMNADGDFVINWSSDGQDGSGLGVYAQRYSTNLAPAFTGPSGFNVPKNTAAAKTVVTN